MRNLLSDRSLKPSDKRVLEESLDSLVTSYKDIVNIIRAPQRQEAINTQADKDIFAIDAATLSMQPNKLVGFSMNRLKDFNSRLEESQRRR